ncbi:hypothetical protein EVAR_24043_1 [Eumeta japonica]|uniref:Uncharacterized protein n=1 Tax=Eumeta variegata TaxID=151549 RepID=A0A4C1VSL1_EUMVA|nr:hypothetical protein EVAR_24043_1 [Eumeta japonica]
MQSRSPWQALSRKSRLSRPPRTVLRVKIQYSGLKVRSGKFTRNTVYKASEVEYLDGTRSRCRRRERLSDHIGAWASQLLSVDLVEETKVCPPAGCGRGPRAHHRDRVRQLFRKVTHSASLIFEFTQPRQSTDQWYRGNNIIIWFFNNIRFPRPDNAFLSFADDPQLAEARQKTFFLTPIDFTVVEVHSRPIYK